jgi:hypothetical protein
MISFSIDGSISFIICRVLFPPRFFCSILITAYLIRSRSSSFSLNSMALISSISDGCSCICSLESMPGSSSKTIYCLETELAFKNPPSPFLPFSSPLSSPSSSPGPLLLALNRSKAKCFFLSYFAFSMVGFCLMYMA